MKLNKIINVIFLILIGVFSILLFWSYYILTKSNIDSLSFSFPKLDFSSPTEKYSNHELKYSLLYPAEWQYQETNNSDQEVIIQEYNQEQLGQAQISIKLHDQANQSLLEWIQAQGKLPLLDEDKLVVNDINGMYLHLKEGEGKQSMLVYVPYNNHVYEIKLTYPVNDDIGYYKKVFRKLITSFKFL